MHALQQTKALRAPHTVHVHKPRCSRCLLRSTPPSMQLDTMRTAQRQQSEISIVVPADPAYATLQPKQKQFGGVSMAGALAAAALLAGFVVNKLRRRSADMGYNYYTGRNDPFMKDVMKNVNTVAVDELSPEIIAAARARRSRERANHKLDLEEVELPENHPWATRKPMSHEQEAAIQARLQVRPRQAQRGTNNAGEMRPRMRQPSRE